MDIGTNLASNLRSSQITCVKIINAHGLKLISQTAKKVWHHPYNLWLSVFKLSGTLTPLRLGLHQNQEQHYVTVDFYRLG